MDGMPGWVMRAIGISAGGVVLLVLIRNVQLLHIGGWSGYRRDLLRIDPATWWLLGAFVVSVLVILAVWAFPCGGILVAG